MSYKIYAPNVHLFAFQLFKDVPDDKQDWLWLCSNNIVNKVIKNNFDIQDWLDINKESGNPCVDLIKSDKIQDENYLIPLDGHVQDADNLNIKATSIKVTGFAYPARLYDSYALWLNLRRPEQENQTKTAAVTPNFFQLLNPDNCFHLAEEAVYLGDTLLLTAWLTDEDKHQDKSELKNIADACINAFFTANSAPPFRQSGQLFNNPIFEYGLFSQISSYRHVLVWLFTNTEADEKINNLEQELLDLFFFRSKIVKAFQKTRSIYQITNSAYRELEKELANLQQIDVKNSLDAAKLEELKDKLKILPQKSLEYATLLRYLEDYQNTIAINAYNYQERLQQIHSLYPDADLSILEQFSQVNSPLFEKQISSDLGYFRHGSGLVDKAIASIRGIVEIEQARLTRQQTELAETVSKQQQSAEKDLQNSITAIGTGIAAGSFVASSSGLITEKWEIPFSKDASLYPHPFFISLIVSTLIAWIAWWLMNCWVKRKTNSQN